MLIGVQMLSDGDRQIDEQISLAEREREWEGVFCIRKWSCKHWLLYRQSNGRENANWVAKSLTIPSSWCKKTSDIDWKGFNGLPSFYPSFFRSFLLSRGMKQANYAVTKGFGSQTIAQPLEASMNGFEPRTTAFKTQCDPFCLEINQVFKGF